MGPSDGSQVQLSLKMIIKPSAALNSTVGAASSSGVVVIAHGRRLVRLVPPHRPSPIVRSFALLRGYELCVRFLKRIIAS